MSDAIAKHLEICGSKGQCKGCGATIWWFKTRKEKNIPLDADLKPHWTSCPNAEDFRKRE